MTPEETKALKEKLDRIFGEFIMREIPRTEAIDEVMGLIKQELEKQKK